MEAQRLRVVAAIESMRAEAEANGTASQQVWDPPGEGDADQPRDFFSDAERTAMEKTPGDEALAALAAMNKAIKPLASKAFDLYWLGRRPVYEILANPRTHALGAGAPAIRKTFNDYPEEAKKIADGDAWEHGYYAGIVAFSRLVQGLATTEWQDVSTDDPDYPWYSPEAQRRAALEEFPMLDS